MKRALLLGAFFLCGAAYSADNSIRYDPPKPMVVIVDVADVRSEPARHNPTYEYDPKQETQVMKGERVDVYEKKGKWVRVEVPDQQEYTHNNRWQGYPGWVEEKFLSADLSREEKISPPQIYDDGLRQKILAEARRHLGQTYLWGGLSLYNPREKTVTGVDCSGLVNWSYRKAGLIIPRDAHEQWMRARKIDQKDLKPADLIFYAKAGKPEKIVHVGMYIGDGKMIEAPQTGEKVHETPVRPSDKDRVASFGTYFPEGGK